MAAALANADVSDVKSDETIVFFPGLGRYLPSEDAWEIQIHAWVFEPEKDSLKRAAALGILRRTLGLDEHAAGTALFKERARLFLVDNKRDKKIVIRLAGATYSLPESEANGHVQGVFRVPASVAKAASERRPGGDLTAPFEAVLPLGDSRQLGGFISLLKEEGLSVVSDIDDTVKVSEVTDKKALLANTFTREFRPVPGMAAAYRALVDRGASFHYVTASPWQLYEPLRDFLDADGFPAGSFDMKLFRAKDRSFLNLFADPGKGKPAAIEPLLRAYPGRQFILVGDAGEKDPEIYGTIARKFPSQIAHIFIRCVGDRGATSERVASACSGVPKERWTVFDDAGAMARVIQDKWPVPSRPGSGSRPGS